MRLDQLNDQEAISRFAQDVAQQAMRNAETDVRVNDGFMHPEDLLAHLKQGRDVPVDYDRLVQAGTSYT